MVRRNDKAATILKLIHDVSGFSFRTTPTVISGPDCALQVGEIAGNLGISRPILVSDEGINAAGILDSVLGALKSAGMQACVFMDVTADPPESTVLEAVALARKHRSNGVIGLGGGSSLDVAKLVAFLMVSAQQLAEIYGLDLAQGPRLPLVQIPTTAGTGSEVTPISIITTGKNEKKGVIASQLLPDVAMLDPNLTLDLPPHITAYTGLDAMVHAIEAYTSKHKKNPLSDLLAREALRLLSGNIRQAVQHGHDRTARARMLLGAMLAGQAFANAPVAAVHALAYPVGSNFHVPHGLSNSLVLPHVLRFNAPDAADLYAELAPILVPGLTASSPEELTAAMIGSIVELIKDLGLETRLQQVGIDAGDLLLLAENAMQQTRLLVNNPRELSCDDALAIYKLAL